MQQLDRHAFALEATTRTTTSSSSSSSSRKRDAVSATHKRSKSDSERAKRDKLDWSPNSSHHLELDMGRNMSGMKERPLQDTMARSCLKREIYQLEKRLNDQFVVRHALEKALGYTSSAIESSTDSSIPKPTKELIREIAVLEFEVMYLEQHLLSLYRRAFDQQIFTSSFLAGEERSKPSTSSQSELPRKVSRHDISSNTGDPVVESSCMVPPRKSVTTAADEACLHGPKRKTTFSGVGRSQSSLLHHSCFSARMSPPAENLGGGRRGCHSQPLSPLDHKQDAACGIISLAEYLGTNIADDLPETPNKLSEDIVRCMGAIYCKISDPPLVYHGLPSSPTSSFSSMSAFSSQFVGDMWSPGCKRGSTLDSHLGNPFRVEGLKEFSGPYNAMVEVASLCRKSYMVRDVERMMLNYKALVHRLESVDPRKLNSEEKLAFWINVHNAMMMHAYLDWGIPQTSMKRALISTKAAYIIGGRTINVDMIQGLILGCRTHRPGQWLRALLSSRMKLRDGDDWQAYAIEHPEPLVHFALCSGNQSDPAVRVYTPKGLYHQLEAAKEEYIRATLGIRKEQKILLPKLIDSFAKDKGLCLQSLRL